MILDSSFLVGLSSLHSMLGLSTLGPLGPILRADSPGILDRVLAFSGYHHIAGEPVPKFS